MKRRAARLPQEELAKRQMHEMQRIWRPQTPMPGSFPDDDDDDEVPLAMFEFRYTALATSRESKGQGKGEDDATETPTALSWESVLQFLNRTIKNPFAWTRVFHPQRVTKREESKPAQTPSPPPQPELKPKLKLKPKLQQLSRSRPAQSATPPRPRPGFASYFELPPTLSTSPPTVQLPTSYVGETRRQTRDARYGLPAGWGMSQFDPAALVPTPSRAVRTQRSPRRWSPYHYEHGKLRPDRSVLRSSKRDYRPFEPSLLVTSPDKYIEEEISPVDVEGDVEMLSAHVPLRKRKVRIATERYAGFSFDTLERIDPVHGIPKYFEKDLGINEKYSIAFERFRDPAPEFDPDESFLDSPPQPSARLYDEQEMSPSKAYNTVHDDRMTSSMDRWASELRKRMGRDITAGMSSSMRARYEQVEAERALEQSIKRAEERRAREAVENAERARVALVARELLAQQKHEEDEFKVSAGDREAMEAIQADEAAKAEEARWAQIQEEIDGKQWKLVADEWDIALPLYGGLKAKMDAGNNPNEVIVENPQLTRHDLGSLLPNAAGDSKSAWLNDSVVMAALDHLVKFANQQLGHNTRQHDIPAPYHVFNSNWFTKVGDGSGIAKWAAKRGVNLSGSKLRGARKILFPVCVGSHWTVTILDPRTGTIESMNSLDTNSDSPYNLKIVNKIRAWLKYELKSDYMAVEWISQRCMTMHQNNASDCGVFTIMNSMARVTGTPTWSMRQQVEPKYMDMYRIWLAGALYTGGFRTAGPFKVHLEDRSYDGDLLKDPDYCRSLLREKDSD